MFDDSQFHIETTFDTTESVNGFQNSLHNSYKEGYIQSKVGSHIIAGVP